MNDQPGTSFLRVLNREEIKKISWSTPHHPDLAAALSA